MTLAPRDDHLAPGRVSRGDEVRAMWGRYETIAERRQRIARERRPERTWRPQDTHNGWDSEPLTFERPTRPAWLERGSSKVWVGGRA